MWTFYTKALHERGGTLVATVVSSGTNYVFSVSKDYHFIIIAIKRFLLPQALLGSFVFGEKTSVVWWLGMSLVVLGLFIVNFDQKNAKKVESKTL